MGKRKPKFLPKGKPAITFLLCLACLWRTQHASYSQDQIAADESAVAKHLIALTNLDNEVRSAAAQALRHLIARHPSGTADLRNNDSGEAAWLAKINRLKVGMLREDVEEVLPPSKICPEKRSTGSGNVRSETYRLDYHWTLMIYYRNPDTLANKPQLSKQEWMAQVQAPTNFTGHWINYYANGQKGVEIDYKDGQYHGTFISYYDNGQKRYEQHYANGTRHGKDFGWYRDGRPSYENQYYFGVQDGRWISWYPDGQKSSESNYKCGKREGLYATWYINGLMRTLMHYHNGQQTGLSAAWDERGKLRYQRQVTPRIIVREDTL